MLFWFCRNTKWKDIISNNQKKSSDIQYMKIPVIYICQIIRFLLCFCIVKLWQKTKRNSSDSLTQNGALMNEGGGGCCQDMQMFKVVFSHLYKVNDI